MECRMKVKIQASDARKRTMQKDCNGENLKGKKMIRRVLIRRVSCTSEYLSHDRSEKTYCLSVLSAEDLFYASIINKEGDLTHVNLA